ncbi:MAG TPA: glycosyltransferase family 4 protein [Thermoleophilaceae bacterium]|jgi:glycosyltransferase involved in cell wall biosynthesis
MTSVCVIYDCLYPHTVGGAERWYRNLAERLAADGHEVTYLTRRQWPRGTEPGVPGVKVIAVAPGLPLYVKSGRRSVTEPLVFGAGTFWHLLRHGRRYDVVHTASFPYFHLLAAALLRPLMRYRLVVDWHEVWTREYWREYLGGVGGTVGHLIQRLCLALPQRAFCFSRLHGERLREFGINGEATVLQGEYAGSLEVHAPEEARPMVMFAGRHIPEKRAPALVPAFARAREQLPDLRLEFFGDGPERPEVLRLVRELSLEDVVDVHGFVSAEQLDAALRSALCMVLPSRREGYGLIVVEASAQATPSVVVSDPDNAATELVEEGVNGFIAPSASPEDLAAAILRVHEGGHALRESTAEWFGRNAERLSLAHSIDVVSEAYRARVRS